MEHKPPAIKCKPTTAQEERPSVLSLVIKKNKGEGPILFRIFTPRPFPYKAVRWIYDVHTSADSDTFNIARLGGMTRSGRIYTPKDLHDKAPKEKEKEKEKEEEESKEETDELLKYIR